MPAKQPEIKFSPFEALFIGEKNKVLKRQPMKNTIFVQSLNQKSKTINLRSLFDLELNTTDLKGNDEIFEVPQRVYEFLNNKIPNFERNKLTENKDVLSYEFKGHETSSKSNDSDKPKYKKSKIKSNKVKFKEKCNQDECEKVVNKVQDALNYQPSIKKFHLKRRSRRLFELALKKNKEGLCRASRYSLRNKHCRFTCEFEYESSQSKEFNTEIEEDNESNYVSKFCMGNNTNIFNDGIQIKNDNPKEFQEPNLTDTIVGMSTWHEQVDLSDPDILLNELFKNNYYCHGDFEFPKCPKTGISDFDNEKNLVDLIYENFPKSIKFESKNSSQDFVDALVSGNIIKPIEDLEIKLKDKQSEQGESVKVSCGTQTSSLDLPAPIDLSSCYLRALENGYITTADGFVSIQNHLKSDENFGGLFINNPNRHNINDLLMASLMKPLMHNSWVRHVQNF